jgi:hypothetical protein
MFEVVALAGACGLALATTPLTIKSGDERDRETPHLIHLL